MLALNVTGWPSRVSIKSVMSTPVTDSLKLMPTLPTGGGSQAGPTAVGASQLVCGQSICVFPVCRHSSASSLRLLKPHAISVETPLIQWSFIRIRNGGRCNRLGQRIAELAAAGALWKLRGAGQVRKGFLQVGS